MATAKAKTKPAAKRLTAEQLMADPKHMLAWLRSKKRTAVVAVDMIDCCRCLGATFLREHGYPDARWYCSFGRPEGEMEVYGCDAITGAINVLPDRKPITAQQAIAAIKAAA